MKAFSARPGPSALLEYCKIRPAFEASLVVLQSNHNYSARWRARGEVCMRIFNAYGALLGNYRKKNRKRSYYYYY